MVVALLAIAGLGCRDHAEAPADAGTDGVRPEAPGTLILEIAVNGCASYDQATVTCSGPPPLVLSFAPVGSQEVTEFVWDFGDGTPTSRDRAPTHTYGHPGNYTVTLNGHGDVGGVKPPVPVTVRVDALSAGAPCDVKVQCADGLDCVCAPGTGCGLAFARGICSTSCAADACDAGAVCAALPLDPPVSGGGAVRAPICIAGCQSSSDCAPGFACQTVAAAGVSAADVWAHGCLPLGAMRDVGEPCRDASERLADGLCTTGTCADVGALGVCSAGCDGDQLCPEETACASFPDGRLLCLRACASDAAACGDRDPLLACTTFNAPAGGSAVVCAPKSCVADSACAPTGRCGPDQFCVRK